MDEEKRKELMRLALTVALADSTVTAEEKVALRAVQKQLNVTDEALAEMVAKVRETREVGDQPIRLTPEQALGALEAMIGVCAADGNVTIEEVKRMERIASRFGVVGTEWQEVLGRAMSFVQGPDEELEDDPEYQRRRSEAETLIEEFYIHMHEWDDPDARAQRFVELGRAAVTPLLRAFESYRFPDHCNSAAQMKRVLVDCLAQMKDTRSVFYLGSFLDMGTTSDREDDKELMRAAASAISQLVHTDFARTDEGVQAARAWWRSTGSRTYKTLAF
jgi:uncharacterized tellurite resistance protein B-like protein